MIGLNTETKRLEGGKHGGELVEWVPADYLLWLYDNEKAEDDLVEYIERHMQFLRFEAGRED